MRDDRLKWAPISASARRLAVPGLKVRDVTPGLLTMVSGSLVQTKFANPVGWPDIAAEGFCILSLRRDRVLVVNGGVMADGWDATRELAVSDATEAQMVLELKGPRALQLLRRGTEISLDAPSRSAARVLFRMDAVLYRVGDETTYRIHVARGEAEAMRKALAAHAGAML